LFNKLKPHSNLLAHLCCGQLLEKLKIGNCGEACVLAAYNLMYKAYNDDKTIPRLEIVQTDIEVSEKSYWSHVFLIVGHDKPFGMQDKNDIESLLQNKNIYLVDPWNGCYVRASELLENNEQGISLLKFILQNKSSLKCTSSLNTMNFIDCKSDICRKLSELVLKDFTEQSAENHLEKFGMMNDYKAANFLVEYVRNVTGQSEATATQNLDKKLLDILCEDLPDEENSLRTFWNKSNNTSSLEIS
ncbi:MAG: hypothetical protein COB50_02495, partial [Thiotrichales bacterium]